MTLDEIIAVAKAAEILGDANEHPIPQTFDPALRKYVPSLSDAGAKRVVLYGADGLPIDKLAVRASELEALLTALKEKDFATETKLEAVRVLLNSLAGEDFATSAKQAEMLAALGKQSTAEKQDTLVALIGASDAAAVNDPTKSGAVIALLKGLLARLQTLEGKIDGITDGTAPAKTELTGSNVADEEAIPVKQGYVERGLRKNVAIPASSKATIFNNVDCSFYSTIVVGVHAQGAAHKWSCFLDWMASDITVAVEFTVYIISNDGTSDRGTGELPIKAAKTRIAISNGDTEEHAYSVVWGVK